MSLLSTTTTPGTPYHYNHHCPCDNDTNLISQHTTPNTPSSASSARRTSTPTLSPHLSFVPSLLSRVLQLQVSTSWVETRDGQNDNDVNNIINDMVTRTSTAVRRALRAPIVQTEPDIFTPQALSLCAIAQFSQVSLDDVHRNYVSMTENKTTIRGDDEQYHQQEKCQVEEEASMMQQIEYTCLKRVHNEAWKVLFPLLKVSIPLLPNTISKKSKNDNEKSTTTKSTTSKRRLSFSKPPKTPSASSKTGKTKNKVETPAKLFSGTHIMVIPSPLLPQSVALTLRSRAESEGAKARLLSPGAVGMAEAQKMQEKLLQKHDIDDTDDDDDEKFRRMVVVADIALTKRHEHKEVSMLDEIVPPKWLTDSLKAKRFKPTSLYSAVTPKIKKKELSKRRGRREFETNDDEGDRMITGGRYCDARGGMSGEDDRLVKKRRLTVSAVLDMPSDFRAEANTTVGKSDGRNDDNDYDDDYDGNCKFDRPEAITVATRLFATPRKKESLGDDDDVDEHNGDERPITIDMTTTMKKTLNASTKETKTFAIKSTAPTTTTTNNPLTPTTASFIRDETIIIKQHDTATTTLVTSNTHTQQKQSNTNTNTNTNNITTNKPISTGDIVIGPSSLQPCRKSVGGRWACEIRTVSKGTEYPANDRICDLLAIVQAAHEAKKDKFRSLGYQRAIARLKTLDYEILNMNDIRRLSSEPNIGSRMVTKIAEIVTTGHFRQADAVMTDKSYTAMQTLCGVWGIGPVRAMQLVHVGVRDIEGLRHAVKTNQVVLDRCQLIGLNRYEDLLKKLPRVVVTELDMYVKRVVKTIDIHVDATIAGSFLRGKESCGDVDILIHGDGTRVKKAMPLIKERMRRDGVLTDDLVEGNGKYFGVFKLPGRQYGRIDLFAVPNEQFPYALLTYTGSAVFNRSMRAKAKTLGYSLSHKGMQRVIRSSSNGKTRLEASIPVQSEREIFDMLDIPYVEPCKRSIS